MAELKPCPFCGGEAEIWYSATRKYGIAVCCKCIICRSQGKAYFTGEYMETAEAEELAEKAWNRRVSDGKAD